MVFVTSIASAETPNKAYFDAQFGKLQQSATELKGGQAQIISILGNVFEGSVPSGGTLTSLCNKNGWNLIVVMGHNNISNPSKVAAGQKFSYPKTVEEFQAALSKGKPLYNTWLKTQKKTFRVNRIKADTVEIGKLNIRVAHVTEELAIKSMKVDELRIRLAEITEQLKIKQANIEQLNVQQANLKQVNIEQMRIRQLEIDNLKALLAQANARCAQLEARPAKVVKQTVVQSVDGSTYVAPSDMRLLSDCGICDEKPFSGNVTKAALKASGGKSVAIIELHDRGSKKSPRFKAKRLYVDAATGRAIPMEWSNGQCIRTYDDVEISPVAIRGLLAVGESVNFTSFSEQGLNVEGKSHGGHLTTAVILIK